MDENRDGRPFMQPKWLTGIRILDFTRLLPGPYATQLLADLGAEVIKVEQTGMGDNMRYYPPYFEGDKSKDRLSALYVCVNHGKKSITLDLKNASDQEKFLGICKDADAVVESFRPGVMTRMNIDYDAVKVVKPDIIYISLSGYGQFGPYRDLPGHDMNYVGLMGNLSLNGKTGEIPTVPGVQAADLGGGLFVVLSLLGALYQRVKTGQGCYVDVAMSDVAFTLARQFITESIATGTAVTRGVHPLFGEYPWYDVFKCKDGRYFVLGLIEDKFWATFCHAPGVNLAEYAKNQLEKGPVRDELFVKVRALLATKTAEAWFALFKAWDIPGTPVQDVLEAARDPHVLVRDLLRFGMHRSTQNIPIFPFPVKIATSQRALNKYEAKTPSVEERKTQARFYKLGEQNAEFHLNE